VSCCGRRMMSLHRALAEVLGARSRPRACGPASAPATISEAEAEPAVDGAPPSAPVFTAAGRVRSMSSFAAAQVSSSLVAKKFILTRAFLGAAVGRDTSALPGRNAAEIRDRVSRRRAEPARIVPQIQHQALQRALLEHASRWRARLVRGRLLGTATPAPAVEPGSIILDFTRSCTLITAAPYSVTTIGCGSPLARDRQDDLGVRLAAHTRFTASFSVMPLTCASSSLTNQVAARLMPWRGTRVCPRSARVTFTRPSSMARPRWPRPPNWPWRADLELLERFGVEVEPECGSSAGEAMP